MTEPRIRFQKEDGVVYPEWGLTTMNTVPGTMNVVQLAGLAWA